MYGSTGMNVTEKRTLQVSRSATNTPHVNHGVILVTFLGMKHVT